MLSVCLKSIIIPTSVKSTHKYYAIGTRDIKQRMTVASREIEYFVN